MGIHMQGPFADPYTRPIWDPYAKPINISSDMCGSDGIKVHLGPETTVLRHNLFLSGVQMICMYVSALLLVLGSKGDKRTLLVLSLSVSLSLLGNISSNYIEPLLYCPTYHIPRKIVIRTETESDWRRHLVCFWSCDYCLTTLVCAAAVSFPWTSQA